MENYIWVAIAAVTSFAIFLIWVLRDRRPGGISRRGVDGPIAVLAETIPAWPEIRRD